MTTTTVNHEVTEVQLDKTHRLYNEATRTPFYRVENSRGDVDAEGNISEYTVCFDRVHNVLTCTCPAGNPPTDLYGQPKYAPRDCWHKRASLVHAKQYRLERQHEQERWQAEAAKHERNAVRKDGYQCYQNRPFSLMR